MHIDYRTMEEDGANYRLGTRKNKTMMMVVVVDAKNC